MSDKPVVRAGLDFSNLASDTPSDKKTSPHNVEKRPSIQSDPHIAAVVGTRAGFSPRTPETKIDGRRLRSKGRTKQLNVRVTPETHARLITRAQSHQSVAEYIEHLLDLDERSTE